MPLTEAQIRELYKKPKNKAHLQTAVQDNARQSFHARPSTNKADSGNYYGKFSQKVKEILNNIHKFNLFEKLIGFPLPTQQIVSQSSDKWNNIFSAQDRAIEYNFNSDKLAEDFVNYLNKIDFAHIIEQNVFTRAKQAVNTFVVIDLPSSAEGDGVEPYVYFVDPSNTVDADEDYKGDLKYLMFTVGEKGKDGYRLIVLDDYAYRSYAITSQDELIAELESPHNLGYCPATFIWSDNIDVAIPLRRFNAILEAIQDMDKLVMAETFMQHSELYASFPLMWRYIEDCGYEEDGEYCDGGVVTVHLEDGRTTVKDCPACKARGLTGPGNIIDVPLPKDKEEPLINTPAGFVNMDIPTLEYNQKKVKELSEKIERNLTGGVLSTTDKAINEDQVRSQYEAQQSVLMYWAENLQKVHKFLLDTIGTLRYGDSYLGSSVSYGSEFFLIDVNTATKEYQEAKNAGLPMYLVAIKRGVVEQLYTRMSPSRRSRVELLMQLEPYVDVSLTQIDRQTEEYELKANFISYIERFERENGPITVFGSKINIAKRIETIKNKLLDYVKENRSLREQGLSQDNTNSRAVA